MAVVPGLAALALLVAACGAPMPSGPPASATPGPPASAEASANPPAASPARGAPVTDLRLHDAASRGDVDGIRGLLAEGLPIDGRDGTGRTPVLAATHAGQTAAVRALIDAGADLDLQDDRLDNVFLYAGAEGLLDILRLANEAGADPAITNRFGGIALIPASERGHVEVVRYLLDESDVDVDHVNRLGWTALLEAIILSDGGPAHQEIVGLLLAAGADPDLADGDGTTPLQHARSRGYAAIERLLLDAGATR